MTFPPAEGPQQDLTCPRCGGTINATTGCAHGPPPDHLQWKEARDAGLKSLRDEIEARRKPGSAEKDRAACQWRDDPRATTPRWIPGCLDAIRWQPFERSCFTYCPHCGKPITERQ